MFKNENSNNNIIYHMLKVKQNTINKLIIPNNNFIVAVSGITDFSFIISNDVTHGETVFSHTATTINERYIEFDLNIVASPADEYLPYKINLEPGRNGIQIVENKYIDILDVEKVVEVKKYSYNKNIESESKRRKFVYKKRR